MPQGVKHSQGVNKIFPKKKRDSLYQQSIEAIVFKERSHFSSSPSTFRGKYYSAVLAKYPYIVVNIRMYTNQGLRDALLRYPFIRRV